MTFNSLFKDTLAAALEIAEDVENYGRAEPMQLIHERAYTRGVETYFATAFEIVDALRGDGNLFDEVEHAAGEALYGLEVTFSDWVHQMAYESYRLMLIEHLSRMGIEV